ncbi:MAG: cupin [Acidobacteria bacterium]|nr:MAG: cupin [Acidobacteriota bacterium]
MRPLYNRLPQEGFMRAYVLGTILALIASAALAQQPAAQSAAATPRLFAGSADVTAMIAKAKSERKPDQANFVQPIVQLAPYNANLEYRVAGVNAPASVHEREAEMFFVVDGTGMLVTGGTLRDEKRTNAENLTGSAIDGGTPRHLAKGDWLMVPEKTAHWFSQIEGTIVLMSIHLPHPVGTTSSR